MNESAHHQVNRNCWAPLGSTLLSGQICTVHVSPGAMVEILQTYTFLAVIVLATLWESVLGEVSSTVCVTERHYLCTHRRLCSANLLSSTTSLISNNLADNCIQTELTTGTIFQEQPGTECLSWKLMTCFFQVLLTSNWPLCTPLLDENKTQDFCRFSCFDIEGLHNGKLPKNLSIAGVCFFICGMEDETLKRTSFYPRYLIEIHLLIIYL